MGASKEELKKAGRFELADPATFEGFDEWVLWLEALLHGPCYVLEQDGKSVLLEKKLLVERLSGLKIEIYPNEHPPPHFHVRSPEVNASFAIEDCRLLKGRAPSSAMATIRYWHGYSKKKLINAWNETRPTNCQVGPYNGA